MFLRGHFFWQVLSFASALLGLAWCIELSENCDSVDNVSLFVSLGTNRTGHPIVNGRLEHPSNGELWKLDTKLEFTKCSTENIPRKVITIKLTGLPPKIHNERQGIAFNPYPLTRGGQSPGECHCPSQRPTSERLVGENQESNEIELLGKIERIRSGKRIMTSTTKPTSERFVGENQDSNDMELQGKIGQIRKGQRITAPPTKPTGPIIPKHLVSKYSQVEGLGFVRVEKKPSKWLEARDKCAAENASLLLPKDLQAAQALTQLFNFPVEGTYNRNMFWVGASDLKEEGKWVSVDGTPLDKATSVPWGAGEPTHKIQENCLLYQKVHKVFADGDCDRVQPFACSIPF